MGCFVFIGMTAGSIYARCQPHTGSVDITIKNNSSIDLILTTMEIEKGSKPSFIGFILDPGTGQTILTGNSTGQIISCGQNKEAVGQVQFTQNQAGRSLSYSTFSSPPSATFGGQTCSVVAVNGNFKFNCTNN